MVTNDILGNAIELIQTGQKTEARKLLEPYIEAHPQDVSAWLWQAETCSSAGSKIKVLEKCLTYNPDNPQVSQALSALNAQSAQQDQPNLQFGWADLEHWLEKELISADQLRRIRMFVEAAGPVSEQPQRGAEQRKGFNLISVAYYFGGFMILLAYTIFMGLQWETLGANGQVAVSFGTIAALWAIGFFLRHNGFKQAGGLLIFAGAGIFPLLVYTLQRALGLWPDSSGYGYQDYYRYVAPAWVVMELASIAVAVVMIFATRFTLISLPIAFWTWYLSMDLTRLISQSNSWSWSEHEQVISILIGAGMLALGIFLQRRAKQDYSIWFYLFGHLIIISCLSALTIDKQGALGLVYLLVYLAFVIASVWLQRRIFLVFGALGCYSYLCYLAFQVFDGALGFVFALAAIGLFMVLSAVGYQKYIRPWLERQFGRPRFSTL
ncbi:MAG: hypothetical protein WA821_01495 [Anaerolineales bacterium]